MSDAGLCYLTAAKVRFGFENRSLSPIELMRALIDRSERIESHINAFTGTCSDIALDQAFVKPVYRHDLRITSGD